jgi:hypothetical protein
MQTARPMALFARNFLHRMPAPAIALGEVSMTSSALFSSNFLRAGDFYELAEILPDLVRRGGLGFVLSRKRRRKQ